MSKRRMIIGSIVLFALAFWSLFTGSAINFLGFAWIAGIWACVALYKKGYGVGIPLIIWILLGWEVLAFLLTFGYAMLFIAAYVPIRKRCPHCRLFINKDATRCPKCQGSIALASA